MREHSRYNVSANHVERETRLTMRAPLTPPAEMAAEKAAQLYALLTMTRGAGFEQFDSLDEDLQHAVLGLASGLALEVLVLSGLAAKEEIKEGRHVQG
ncbi:hypothetical protein D3C72_1667670 [compost metagenome]